jgi:electron transfer flavoprotein beta subunit
MSMNPFDEIAVEEAVRLKERPGEVIAVWWRGPVLKPCAPPWPLVLTALSQETDADLQPLAVAKPLKALIDKEQPSLVILGKQVIDDAN